MTDKIALLAALGGLSLGAVTQVQQTALKNDMSSLQEKVTSLQTTTASLEAKPVPSGAQGEKGEPGQAGKEGKKGDKGDPGEAGKEGGKGEKGEPGEAGQDGTDGTDGIDGKDGNQGGTGTFSGKLAQDLDLNSRVVKNGIIGSNVKFSTSDNDINGSDFVTKTQEVVNGMNTVAKLDQQGKVPASQLSLTNIVYAGSWDPNSAEGVPVASINNRGQLWVANKSKINGGKIPWGVGDWNLSNGDKWERIPSFQTSSYTGIVDFNEGSQQLIETLSNVNKIHRPFM